MNKNYNRGITTHHNQINNIYEKFRNLNLLDESNESGNIFEVSKYRQSESGAGRLWKGDAKILETSNADLLRNDNSGDLKADVNYKNPSLDESEFKEDDVFKELIEFRRIALQSINKK